MLQARLKATANDVDGAIALLDRVIAKDPTNYEALQLKGELLFVVKGDADAALKMQRQALVARPDWFPAQASVLEILLRRRDLAAAKTEIEQLKKAHPNDLQTRYFEARLAFLNRDYKAARELLQPVVAAAPDNLKVLLLSGATELQAGSLAQAESFASKAVQRFPDSSAARRLLAQIEIRSGQPQKAQGTLQPLIAKGEDAETLNLAAQAALQVGDAASAESYFGRAAKIKPDDPRSRTALALVQSAKGHPDVGLSQLEEISASDPGTIADMAIISARMRQRDFAAALKAVDALERKQPGKPFASQLRGQIQMARGDEIAARQSFAAALGIDPLYYPAAASLAALDLKDKRPDEARKRFDKLLAADPKDIRALLAIVELRARAGASKEEIAALLVDAIKLNPAVAAPRVQLVDLNLRSNDDKTALSVAQEGVAALPDNAEMLDALGRAQLASGDIALAISTFNKLVAKQPLSLQPRMHLAEAYMASNNPTAARETLQRTIAVAPKFLPAQRGLIMLELSGGRPDQALAIARKVQTELPDQSAGYLFAGDIEASRKNWEAAAAAYRAALGREASTEVAVKLHGVLGLAKKSTEADSFSIRWVNEHPLDTAFRTYLGDFAISKLDFPRAESEYLAILKVEPDNANALNNLAWVTNKLKRPGAMAYAERANALQPEQPAFMDTLATILADAGQASKALEIQKKVVSLQPDNPSFRLNLAKFYIKAGDKSQAKKELEQLAKLGDKFAGQAEVGELLKTL